MSSYDPIDEALNTQSSDIVGVGVDKTTSTVDVSNKPDEIQKDYEYTRANLYSLIEKGQESLNGILELAGESASPRAYEVAGQIIKSVADTTDKLIDLQKKVKEVEEDSPKKSTGNVTNNALFVGSTSELSKMLKDGILNNDK
tara:strand:+ start:44 stop:472 length:429 start_codon:yes stop_codon:yes gene_type:complete